MITIVPMIRTFRSEDISDVLNLIAETFNEIYDSSMLHSFYQAWPEGFLVVESAHGIIGVLISTLTTPNQARILILGVKDGYRDIGIGSMLLRSFIHNAISRKIEVITLEVRCSNLKALRFYQRFGFIIAQKIPQYYKDGEDGYVMYLKLQHHT